MEATLVLPAILDLRAAAALKADIQSRRGAPLDLDASKVERLGGLCLQILITTAEAWRSADLPLRVLNAGAAFQDDVRLMDAARLLPVDKGSEKPC